MTLLIRMFATLANSSAINIYPNPGHDIINIKMPAVTNELRSFRITNIQGALLMHGQLPSNSSMLDISQLPGGLYFIKTRDTKGTTLSGKIIKH
jgi:hypothetical protein